MHLQSIALTSTASVKYKDLWVYRINFSLVGEKYDASSEALCSLVSQQNICQENGFITALAAVINTFS